MAIKLTGFIAHTRSGSDVLVRSQLLVSQFDNTPLDEAESGLIPSA